jgi:hypothetical protein
MGRPKKDNTAANKQGKEKPTKTHVSKTDLPRRSLEECLKVAKPIHETYADSEASLDELAVAVNSSPNTVGFKYTVWGAQAYGLIIRNEEKYKLSETAKKIFSPESLEEKRDSLIKATTIPTILSRFYTDYNGKLLPENEFFDNILISRYSIPRDRVEEAKQIIIDNARFTGLLNEHDSGKKTIRLEGVPLKQEGFVEKDEENESTSLTNTQELCFYITPIGEDGSEIRKHSDMLLKHLVEPTFGALGLKVIRADKIEKSGLITQQIFEHIVSAKICIADLSYGNPNAFYELGIRHMTKKPTIQVIRKGDKIPFDVSQGRTITVDVSDIFTVMDKVESARNELTEHIKAIIDPKSNSQSEDNPVSVYLPNLTVKL